MRNNIYKLAREMSGITLEDGANILKISSNTLIQYEAYIKIPDDDTVNNMVTIYNSPWLACLHFMRVQGIEGVEEVVTSIIDNDQGKNEVV